MNVSRKDILFRMDELTIGENIRKFRARAGLTLAVAAEKSNLSKSTLSKIERGQISPPISTLIRIAKALAVPISEFFIEEGENSPYVMTRKHKGQLLIRDGSKFGYSYEALAIGKRDKYVEPFLITINPHDPPGKFHHSGQEFIYMLSGGMNFTIGQETFALKAGDSLYFDSSQVHQTRVAGKHPAQFLCVFIQDIPSSRSKRGKHDTY
jgi:transcriptional regulator with XRE-family HTH domain